MLPGLRPPLAVCQASLAVGQPTLQGLNLLLLVVQHTTHMHHLHLVVLQKITLVKISNRPACDTAESLCSCKPNCIYYSVSQHCCNLTTAPAQTNRSGVEALRTVAAGHNCEMVLLGREQVQGDLMPDDITTACRLKVAQAVECKQWRCNIHKGRSQGQKGVADDLICSSWLEEWGAQMLYKIIYRDCYQHHSSASLWRPISRPTAALCPDVARNIMMIVKYALPDTNRSLTGLPCQLRLLISALLPCPEGSQFGPGTLPSCCGVHAPMSAQASQVSTQANEVSTWTKSHDCRNSLLQL